MEALGGITITAREIYDAGRTCIADDCDRNAKTRGLCQKHYLAAWRGNGPVPLPKRTSVDLFWAKVNKAEGSCWRWTGSQRRGGYGRVRIGGRDFVAHRVAYELTIGPIPDGLQLDHLCRNRLCVRPAHLEPVTGQVNTL